MKKLTLFIAISMCLTILMSGCGKESISSTDLKPMIMVNGNIYLDTGVEAQMDEKKVVDGEILSTVSQTEKPTEDDQSNFGAVGNSYIIDNNDVVVQINDKWFRFSLE